MAKEKGIKLSPKHWVNPSILRCFACGEEMGIALLGRINKEDDEAPKEIMDGSLCPNCQSAVNKGGLIIVETKEEKAETMQDRTGRMVIVSKEYKERLLANSDNKDGYFRFMQKDLFERLFGEALKEKEAQNEQN